MKITCKEYLADGNSLAVPLRTKYQKHFEIMNHVLVKNLILKMTLLVKCLVRSNYILYSYKSSVCNAGYYKSGSSCEQCTGNKIKTTAGDATNCDADEPCDGVGEVPNANHTTCGKIKTVRVHLHQSSASTRRQICNDDSDSVLIENNNVT